jgi:rare lipoprotein A
MADGALFNPYELTAASRTLALGARAKVCVFMTAKCTTVTITDRGPYRAGRIIDLSLGAARALGVERQGLVLVTITEIASR